MDICAIASQYVAWDPCEETRTHVEQLLQQNNVQELEKLLGSRLAFGTAGLRGPMGSGYNRMNDLTIQGLIAYLTLTCGENEAQEKGVVIGYDHRERGALSSKHFAEICVAVLLSKNFRVIMLDGFVPTPFVPFGVTHYGCAAGIMVTASHNPKEDNGFKVYWGNGSQIIPPHDAGIAECIVENLAPWKSEYDTSLASFLSSEKFNTLTAELAHQYYQRMKKLSVASAPISDPLRIAYSAMHGVGSQWIERAFCHVESINNLDAPLHVPCQKEPDPSFPTVKFPNPEEKGALNESMKFADFNNCHLILANDPDADRLAAAEKLSLDGGESVWRLFTGNEIGIILGHYQIKKYVEARNSNTVFEFPVKPAAVVTTVVSSKMLKRIAEVEGITYSDTLTGFKWIGNECIRLQESGYDILFSFEEALGYCVGDALTDKDGISAAVVFAELASQLHSAGHTLSQHLESLYSKYGLFVSYNTYVFSYDRDVTNQIFERLRRGGDCGQYIVEVGSSKVTRLRDVTLGFDSGTHDKKSTLPLTPDSHMIMYEFDNNCSIILRTSGTEPKIKCYSEISSGSDKQQSEVKLRDNLVEFVNQCILHLLQPEKNYLVMA